VAALTNQLHLVTWTDVFVLIDQGKSEPAHYGMLGELVLTLASSYSRGIGGLVIIPPNATPPSDAARVAMNAVMRRLGPALRCFCWQIEGGGFQGAMVRGVLTGVKMFGRLPFETHVTTNLTDGLSWIVRNLDGGDRRLATIGDGVRWIEEERRRSVGRAATVKR
jgi:hypothetical protein